MKSETRTDMQSFRFDVLQQMEDGGISDCGGCFLKHLACLNLRAFWVSSQIRKEMCRQNFFTHMYRCVHGYVQTHM